MQRFLGLAVLIAGALAATPARAVAPPVNAPHTVHYDVADLLYKPGGKTGLGSVEEIVRVIIEFTGGQHWSTTRKGAGSIDIINDTRLEVRTTGGQHGEIQDLLKALRRLNDVNVDVRSELLEVDRAFYEKTIKPALAAKKRFAGSLDEEGLKDLRKHSKVVRSVKARLANGREGTVLSLRKAVTYNTTPSGLHKAGENYKIAYAGLTLKATAVVSADRRFVRMQLRQDTADLVTIRKKAMPVPPIGNLGSVESPEIVKSAVSATVRVDDSYPILMPVHARLGRGLGKDKVLVVLLQPLIYIEEEEKEEALQGGKR